MNRATMHQLSLRSSLVKLITLLRSEVIAVGHKDPMQLYYVVSRFQTLTPCVRTKSNH